VCARASIRLACFAGTCQILVHLYRSAVELQSNGRRTIVESKSNRSCNHFIKNPETFSCTVLPYWFSVTSSAAGAQALASGNSMSRDWMRCVVAPSRRVGRCGRWPLISILCKPRMMGGRCSQQTTRTGSLDAVAARFVALRSPLSFTNGRLRR